MATQHFTVCFAPRGIEWYFKKLKKKDKYWPIQYVWMIQNKWRIDDSWEDIYAVQIYKIETWAYIRGKEDISQVLEFLKEQWVQVINWNSAQLLESID